MRYVRYAQEDQKNWGILLNDELIQPLTAAPYLNGIPQGAPVPLHTVMLLAPCQPSKIVAVGKNYLDHIAEFDSLKPETPILFMKPTTAILDPNCPIILPADSVTRRVDYEGELAVVISQRATQVKAEDAKHYILGFTALNDVTARDIQKKDGQWTRAKGFDTFAPIGPVVTDEVEPKNL